MDFRSRRALYAPGRCSAAIGTLHSCFGYVGGGCFLSGNFRFFSPAAHSKCKFSNVQCRQFSRCKFSTAGFQKIIFPGYRCPPAQRSRKTFGGTHIPETNRELFENFSIFDYLRVQILKPIENLHFLGLENYQLPGRPCEWFRWFLVAGFRFILRREHRRRRGAAIFLRVWRFLRFPSDFRGRCKFSKARI